MHRDSIRRILGQRARFVHVSHTNDEAAPMHCAWKQCRIHYLQRNASALSSTDITLYFTARKRVAPVGNYKARQYSVDKQSTTLNYLMHLFHLLKE
jgi:hypothetical protein